VRAANRYEAALTAESVSEQRGAATTLEINGTLAAPNSR
jgi:hypothetical protein